MLCFVLINNVILNLVFFLVQSLTYPVHSHAFFLLQIFSLLFNCVIGKVVSYVGPQNKIGHPACSHKKFKQVSTASAYRI